MAKNECCTLEFNLIKIWTIEKKGEFQVFLEAS